MLLPILGFQMGLNFYHALFPFPMTESKGQKGSRMEEPGSLHHHMEESHQCTVTHFYLSEKYTSSVLEPGSFGYSASTSSRAYHTLDLRPEKPRGKVGEGITGRKRPAEKPQGRIALGFIGGTQRTLVWPE